MPFAEPRAKRHDSVGAAIGLGSAATPSCSERGSRERSLGDRVHPRQERAEAGGGPLGSGSKRQALGPSSPRDDARQQPAGADGGYPQSQRRPSILIEARLPGAHPLPGFRDGVPHQPKQAERQADRRRRVVAAGAKPPRQNRRDPAAPPTPVPTHGHGDHLGLAISARRAADLPLADAMPVQAQPRPQRLARRAAATAAARPHSLRRRQILSPFLDRDRRVDDAVTARSSLHECRARREAATTNLRLPSPFCGRHHVAARSIGARLYLSGRARAQSPSMPGNAFRTPARPSNCWREIGADHINWQAP